MVLIQLWNSETQKSSSIIPKVGQFVRLYFPQLWKQDKEVHCWRWGGREDVCAERLSTGTSAELMHFHSGWCSCFCWLQLCWVPALEQLWQDEAGSSRYARFLFLSEANTEILHKADCVGQEVGIQTEESIHLILNCKKNCWRQQTIKGYSWQIWNKHVLKVFNRTIRV